MMALAGLATCGDARAAGGDEVRAKAASLLNLSRFISGMGGSNGATDGELVVGVLGPNTVVGALQEVTAAKSVRGEPMRIRELSSLADYQACDIIFISGEPSRELQEAVIRQTDQQSVLLVAETPGFCQLGGTANLRPSESGNVGLEINIDAAGRRGLLVDARLMTLAKILGESGTNGLR